MRSAAAGGSPCPDLNLLAGHAEGRLEGAERTLAETHLAGCDSCRAAVDAARAGLDPESAAAPPRFPGLRIAAAAALLGVAALGSYLAFRPAPARSLEEDLLASAEALLREEPRLFAGFRPLDAAERGAPPATDRSGATRAAAPAGRVLDGGAAFSWEAQAGEGPWRVRLFRQRDGRVVAEGEAAAPPFPLPAGTPAPAEGESYLWEAAWDGPLGRVEARSSFTVATARERADLEAGLAAIDRIAAASAAAVLRTRWAIHRGFIEEARRLPPAGRGE